MNPPYGLQSAAGPAGAGVVVPSSGLDLTRRKQINTLRIFNENVSEVRPDAQYRVDFRLSDEATEATLHVLLPPGFPFGARPSIVLGPAAAVEALAGHPWLDRDGNVVAAPGLLNFSVHSDLGRVVQVIKRELAKTPLEGPAQTAATSPTKPVNSSMVRPPRPFLATTGKAQSAHLLVANKGNKPGENGSQNHHVAPAGAVRRQTYVSSLTGLNDLTDEELKEMATDETAALDFCRKMRNPTRDRHGQMIAAERQRVEELLRENAELEERVDSTRTVVEQKVGEAATVREEARRLHAAVAESARSLSPSVMVDRLRIAGAEADEASEVVAEGFLAGQMDVGQFLKDYVSARSLVHARKVRLDQFRKNRGGSANT